MRTLQIDATDREIKALVIEWSELLAQRRFSDALEMFPSLNEEIVWTPETLTQVIAGYGVFEPEPGVIDSLLQHHGVTSFEITTLLGRPDANEIIDTKIDVDRQNLFGLDPGRYLGMVHYDDVPLSGFRSDLTASFHIKLVGSDKLTLEFHDLHVM